MRALLDDAGRRRTRSTRRSCAGSTTTRARCSSSSPSRLGRPERARRRRALRPAGRGARRPGDARRRLGGGGRADPARGRGRGASRRSAVYVAVAKPEAVARGASGSARLLRAQGYRAEVEQAGPLHEGAAEAGGPARSRHDGDRRDGIDVKDMGSGEQKHTTDMNEVLADGASAGAMKAPRPNDYRDHWAGQLRAEQVGETIRVAGWVHRRRDHGGLIFIDLRDRTGLLQLVFRPEEAPDAHAIAERLRSEHVISVSGELVRREQGAVNPNLPTGEVELVVREHRAAGRERDAAVPDRRGRPGRRGAAPALPLPRPAQAGDARQRSSCAIGSSRRSATSSATRASSRSRRRSSPAPRPRARATSSSRAGCCAAPGTRCRSRRRSSSSC